MQIKIHLANEEVQSFVASRQGLLAVSLVREFLSYLNMQFTLSVFDPESCESVSYTPIARSELLTELGLTGTEQPILQTVVAQLLKNSENHSKNNQNSTFTNSNNNREADKSNISL